VGARFTAACPVPATVAPAHATLAAGSQAGSAVQAALGGNTLKTVHRTFDPLPVAVGGSGALAGRLQHGGGSWC